MDASHQEEKDNRDKEQGQYLPWYVDANVALQDDLRPATGDIDNRCHGQDIADANDNGRGSRHQGSEGFPDEGDKQNSRAPQ